MLRAFAICIAILTAPASAIAQVELSFYTGAQSAPSSDATIRGLATELDTFDVDWEGRSFEAPIYYGLRATKWRSETFGVGLDFAHNKVYPRALPQDFSVFEMADGLNTVTVNAYRRWNDVAGGLTPYVGGGLGVAVPHVEVTNDQTQTSGYQVTGPAATFIAGASLPINDQWSVFGEYKGTFSANTAELDDGATLETDIVTNALNIGVSFNF